MTEEIKPTTAQEIVKAAPAEINPYQPPSVALDAPPRPQPRPAGDPPKYKPWMRPLTYVVFLLGTGAATWALFSVTPFAVVYGWIALGMGIPAVLLAKKEIGRFPQAAEHGFIKWGRRTGLVGVILGPIAAVIWIIIWVAVGINF
ncbi:MAG: hypothetical protein M0R80_28645 [Proteobacteria bacterium]|jgi:hypothetical protein|nr:hypothetical protein [Pseudomonadota bacterium]